MRNVPIWLGLVALSLSLVLTPLFRNLFRMCGFVDHPDQDRKIHSRPIPRAGGMAIALSYLGAFLILQVTTGTLDARLSLVWKILPAAGIIFVIGIIDDLWGLTAWQKLTGEVLACGVACLAGIQIIDIIGVHKHAWWTVPITILWLLACTNAFNLVDGMDGLAGGTGLFATLTIFGAAILDRNVGLAMATLPLAGCLLGFLRYNFAPATVFLGDSGSLSIGFLLGCYSVIWAQKSATLLGMMAPTMALSIPLLDVALAIARRFLRRRPVFSPDRGHIHHRLLDRGMSPRQVAFIFYGLCSLVALFSLSFSQSHNNRISSAIVLLFCAAAWLGIQYLGYAEFRFAGRLLISGDIQRALNAQLELDAFGRALTAANTPESCVRLIREGAPAFGFEVVRLQLAGEALVDSFRHPPSGWEARITLHGGDFIELARASGTSGPPEASAHGHGTLGLTPTGAFLDLLRGTLPAKLPEFKAARTPAVSRAATAAW